MERSPSTSPFCHSTPSAFMPAKKAKPSAKDEKKMIGKVNSDGTYQVILPDGFDYILFEGEKKAYLVVQSNTQLNVVL